MKRPSFYFEGETGASGGAGAGATLITAAPSPAPAAAAGSWSWAGEDGKLNEGWLDKLGDGLNADPSLRSIDSLPNLAKSYVETKKLIGKKLEMPGEGATPEQVAAWRKTVGAPDAPEGYLGEAKSLRPEAIPETMWSADSEKAFLQIAHKHSLPPAAVKEILAFYGEDVAKAMGSAQEREGRVLAEEGAKLKAMLGADYDASLSMANRVAKTVGLDPMNDPIFSNAYVVQAFAKMGKLLSEDKLVKGDPTGGISGGVRERARDITDPKSQSVLAREYRGEFGPERQTAAQTQYHQLLQAAESK